MAIMNPYNYKKPVGAQVAQSVEGGATDSGGSNLTKNKSDAYLEQKIMNACPEELTMMLYDGLVKFIKQAVIFNEQGMIENQTMSI